MLCRTVNEIGQLAIAALVSLSVAACESEPPQLPESVDVPVVQLKSALTAHANPDCASALGIQVTGPSLVLNDTAILASRFPLSATLSNIIETSGHEGTAEDLMATMLETMNDPHQINLISGFPMPTDVRIGEAEMIPNAVISGMQPSALFNRLDLAPADGSNCGEYRISYGKNASDQGMPSGSFHIIFEAKYPNPSPELGLDGCRPIAEFWASLEDSSLTDEARGDLLAQFYYDGFQAGSTDFPQGVNLKVDLPPVISWGNYNGSMGQVRTNNFVEFEKWQLREYRTGLAGSDVVFDADTVKGNALAELFGSGASPVAANSDQFNTMRSEFQSDFVTQQMNFLMAPEANGAQTATDVITSFGMDSPAQFDEFQSDAQGLSDDPKQHVAGTTFEMEIAAAIPPETGLTASHILNRAGAMTCGGCHRFSRDREIAPSEDVNGNGVLDPGEDRDGDGVLDLAIRFPRDAGFVHVTSNGGLSAALINHFLPVRKRLLESFLCETAETETEPELDEEFQEAPVNPIAAAKNSCQNAIEGQACTLSFDGVDFQGSCSTLFGDMECVDIDTLSFFFGPDDISNNDELADDDSELNIIEPAEETCDGEHPALDESPAMGSPLETSNEFDSAGPQTDGVGSNPDEAFVDSVPEGSRYEMGRAYVEFSLDSHWTYVPFAYPFADIPAVFIVPDATGTDPCHTRVRNITQRGFETTCVEPEGEDGPHEAMEVAFIAAIEGEHYVGDRRTEVACRTVSQLQHNVLAPIDTGWNRVGFSKTFYKSPVLLAQIQTDYNEVLGDKASERALNPWLTMAVKNVSPNGFQVALELSEVTPAEYVEPERVCYAAYEQGLTHLSNDDVSCQFISRGNVGHRRGEGDGCHEVRLDESIGYTPLVVGFKTTRNDYDGGWTRSCRDDDGNVGFYIEEDRAQDLERKHVGERVDVIACSDSFHF